MIIQKIFIVHIMILTNNRFASYLGFTVYIESIVTKNPSNIDRKIIKSYCKTKDRIFNILPVVDDSETSMKSAEYSVEE